MENYPVLLKAKDVQRILGVSNRVAYEVMERKDFPLIRFGRSKRVRQEDLDKWIEQNKNTNNVS